MLIILDRDGVINHDSFEYIKSPAEWVAISGSLAAIAALNQAGHTVVIATNQSGLARGLYDEKTLENIHTKMRAELAAVGGHIDGIFYCPHHPDEHCACRKPKPGLLLQIQNTFRQQHPEGLKDAVMVGDAIRDLEAAHAVGCRAALVKTGKGASSLPDLPNSVPCYDDLSAFVEDLLT